MMCHYLTQLPIINWPVTKIRRIDEELDNRVGATNILLVFASDDNRKQGRNLITAADRKLNDDSEMLV